MCHIFKWKCSVQVQHTLHHIHPWFCTYIVIVSDMPQRQSERIVHTCHDYVFLSSQFCVSSHVAKITFVTILIMLSLTISLFVTFAAAKLSAFPVCMGTLHQYNSCFCILLDYVPDAGSVHMLSRFKPGRPLLFCHRNRLWSVGHPQSVECANALPCTKLKSCANTG
jgi:hypothetical protein